jgi:hypothetical protein
MVAKVLAWSALGAVLLFVILSLTALFSWDSLGDTAPLLVWVGAIPLLVAAILLAVALLVVTAFFSNE